MLLFVDNLKNKTMKKINFKKGFTLIELLVVVAIIGILASVVLASLNNANSKGKDAAVKSNLKNAVTQGEILYNTRSANKETYTGVCTNGVVAGETTARGIGELVLAAAKATGLSVYGTNIVGSATTATCNNSANAWAVQVPLQGSTVAVPKMWCVDSTGKSKQEAVNSLTTAATYACI